MKLIKFSLLTICLLTLTNCSWFSSKKADQKISNDENVAANIEVKSVKLCNEDLVKGETSVVEEDFEGQPTEVSKAGIISLKWSDDTYFNKILITESNLKKLNIKSVKVLTLGMKGQTLNSKLISSWGDSSVKNYKSLDFDFNEFFQNEVQGAYDKQINIDEHNIPINTAADAALVLIDKKNNNICKLKITYGGADSPYHDHNHDHD